MNLPTHIKRLVKLSPEVEKEITSFFIREEYPKGHHLFGEGAVCRHIFYIEKGLVRLYHTNNNGKEITAWFSSENSFLTAIDSYYNHAPTFFNCELLEDSIIYSIRYSDVEKMLNNTESARFAFHALYDIAKKMTEYIGSIKFKTAEERYNTLMQDYPLIFQRVNLGYIASYLGITQETLSRIRAGK